MPISPVNEIHQQHINQNCLWVVNDARCVHEKDEYSTKTAMKEKRCCFALFWICMCGVFISSLFPQLNNWINAHLIIDKFIAYNR